MSEQIGTRAFARRMKDNIPQWGEKLPQLPSLIHAVLEDARHGRLQVRSDTQEWERLRKEIRAANRRTFSAIVGSALIISAALLLGLDGYAPRMWNNAPMVSWLLGGLGFLILFIHAPAKD